MVSPANSKNSNKCLNLAPFSAAFVGHTDSVSCGYDDGDDDRGCPWQLQEGRIVNAQGTTRPLPSVDSEGNQFGNDVIHKLPDQYLFIIHF